MWAGVQTLPGSHERSGSEARVLYGGKLLHFPTASVAGLVTPCSSWWSSSKQSKKTVWCHEWLNGIDADLWTFLASDWHYNKTTGYKFIVGYCPPCVYPLSTRQTQHIIMEYYFQWRKFKCPLGGNRERGCLISDTWKCGFTLSQHTHTYTHIHTCDTRVVKNLQVWCWWSVNLKVLLQVPNEFKEAGTPKQQNDCRTRLMKKYIVMKNNTRGSWVMCPTCLCCWILLKLDWQACCPCARWGVLYPCIQKCW